MNHRRLLRPTLAAGLMLFCAGPALAQDCEFEPFGNAEVNARTGIVTAISDADATDPFGGVQATLPAGTTFADLDLLSTEYNLTNDGALWGSPRFQITLNQDADANGFPDNVFVYLGTAPDFNDAGGAGWESSGNLIEDPDLRYDLSQVGGAFYSDYDDALALVGGTEITGISLVADAGPAFPDGEQTVLFRNIRINDCVAFDADGDGVTNGADRCPDSDTEPFVDIDGRETPNTGVTTIPNRVDRYGCTVQDLLEAILDSNPRNHGQFVSAVAKLANNGRKAGVLSNTEANALKQAAAQSSVGQPTNGGGNPGGGGGNPGGGNGNVGGGNGNGNGNGNGGNGNGNGRGNGNGGGNGRGNGRR